MAYKFNPGFQTDDEAVTNFVVRQPELAVILDALTRGAGPVRICLVAPRGAGKTTMCRRVLAEVRTNDELVDLWQPIFLGEESYTVTTPGEFFLECLFHLADDLADISLKAQHREALLIADDTVLLERCSSILRDYSQISGRRLLIIVENFHILLDDQIGEDRVMLLDALADAALFGVLATSVAQSPKEDGSDALDGYEILPLKPLTLDSCHALWSALTNQDVPQARIRPLEILTGGSPRLIHILAEFMRTPSLRDLMVNLNQLIDQNTEYFKSQLDTLPAQERKVFAALLDSWDPSTAKQIAEAARVSVNTASAMLGRLGARGAVVKEPGPGRSALYHAAERLFNIYYLMRRRSHPSSRVRALVAFMTEYYDRDELVATTAKLVDEACLIEPAKRSDYHWAFEAILTGQPETVRASILAQTPADFLQSFRQDLAPRQSMSVSADQNLIQGEEAHQLIQESQEALADGKIDQARELLCQAIELNPTSPEGYVQSAILHLHCEEHEAAVRAAQRATELDSRNPGPYMVLGLTEFLAGSEVNAEAAFNRALEIDADFVPAIYEIAKLREQYEDHEGAINLYRRAAALGDLPDELASRFAGLLIRKGATDEAEFVLREAIKDSVAHLESRRNLASLLADDDRAAEGAELLRTHAIKSDDWIAWADLGSFQLAMGDFAEARSSLERSIELGVENPTIYRMLATTLRKAGEPVETIIALADEMLGQYGDDSRAWIMAGDIFRQNQLIERAEKTYRHAATLKDGEPAWTRLARLLLKKRASDAETEVALRKAVEAVVEHGACGPMREVAELLVRHGEDEGAVKLLEQALAANQECYCSLVLRGDIASRTHDDNAARVHFQAALKLNESGVSALIGLARVSGSVDAHGLIDRAIEADPDNPLCLLARAQLDDRDLEARIADGAEAVERDPDLIEAHLFLAPLEAQRGETTAALAHLGAALSELAARRELIPSFVDTALDLARAGLGADLIALLNTEAGRVVEPLAVALQLDQGDTPPVAMEILEVARDILGQLRASE